MAEQHKRLALQPSSAKRWLSCTASPIFIRDNADKIPAEVSKPYADEGTVAHEQGALGLLTGGLLSDECPEAMRPHVAGYVEAVLAAQAAAGAPQLVVEEKVPLFYMPERNGQIDARFSTKDYLVTWDYKHGAGVKVFATGNPQLLIYSRSTYEYSTFQGLTLDPGTLVSMNIFQPRARGEDGSATSTWEISLPEMLRLSDEIGATAKLIQEVANGEQPANLLKFAPLDEPEVCGWCPAKGICTARLAGAPAAVSSELEIVTPGNAPAKGLPEVSSLSQTELASLWAWKKRIVKFLDDVEEHLKAQIHADPSSVPGLKLVASKGGHRKWTDEEAAVKLLAPKLGMPDIFEKTLKSPAAIEALLKATGEELSTRFTNRLESLVTKGEGKPVIALASDKRPALVAPEESGHPFAALSEEQ